MKYQNLYRCFIIFLFTLMNASAYAEKVSQSKAKEYAVSFFRQQKKTFSSDASLVLVWEGEHRQSRSGDSPAFYVFNRGNNEGFIIISGNDSARPVLAYSYEGRFDVETMPDNVKAWMHALEDGIRLQAEHRISRSTRTTREWNEGTRVSKEIDLNTPNWDQVHPYYLKCPTINGMYCYPGCANTATAIVMGYHKWPDHGIGTLPKYTTSSWSLSIPAITLGEKYQWDIMPYINNNPEDLENYESIDAVATLMYHVAVMGKADFSISGTGSYLGTIRDALPVYMKYSPKIKYLQRKNYTDEAWSRKLRDEIDARRPVVYEGFDENTGHAIVIDGYNDKGYFNINWGWGGRYNGFYSLNDLAPGLGGTGASGSGTYNLLQGGLFGIEPRYDEQDKTNLVEFTENPYYPTGIKIEGLTMPAKKGDEFGAEAGLILNIGTNKLNGECILAMTDAQGKRIEEYCRYPIVGLEPGMTSASTGNKTIYTIQKDVKPGYRMRVLFKPNDSNEYQTIKCDEKLGVWEYLLAEEGIQEEQKIEDMTSLSFNRKTGELTLVTLEGVVASFKAKDSGQDCSSVLTHKGTQISIKSNLLGKGSYVLELKKKSDLKVIELAF